MKRKDQLVQLRAMSVEELQKKALELSEERMRMRFKASLGQLEGSHQFRANRQMIAQIKTVMSEKNTGDRA